MKYPGKVQLMMILKVTKKKQNKAQHSPDSTVFERYS